ncbi:competence type IV pilus major pilin ComGC [Candidatus Caldatribacterium sp.]|uniref:competence type IV pilus major pilin ComGC n=1 Tax=Candidatus Caldatribacterium sp. TaxID=2282143 RepID=UPI0038738F08
MRPQRRKNAGFTLIELVVVVAILGFLVAIGIPRYMAARETAAANATKANLHNLAAAIELYLTEKSDLPGSLNDLVAAGYIGGIPKTPKGNNYTYARGSGLTYTISDPDIYTVGGSRYKYSVKEGGVIVEEQQQPQPTQ